MKKKQNTSNYDFFIKTDTSQYHGQWIAIAGRRIVAHGKDAQKVYQTAQKKAPGEAISLAKTPREQMLAWALGSSLLIGSTTNYFFTT